MLFHVVPENVFGDRAGYSRPCYYPRHPCRRQQQLSNMGFLHDILRPLMVMSHNNPGSESCHGRRPCDTETCQGVTRRGAQKGECPSQKQVPKSRIACLDFRGFSADEIKVKVTDSAVVVCGRHDDPGNSFRVTRTLPLPPGVDKTGIICRYVDGKVTIEIPASAKDSVEDKPEKQEDEKKVEHKEENIQTDPTRTSDTGDDDDDDGGMEIDREAQAAFQVGMEHLTGLFSSIFGLPPEEKKDLVIGSPDKKEESAEQANTALDREEPRPEDDNTTETESLDVEEERSEEEKGEEGDTCLMLKYDEKLSLTDDADDFLHVEKQTTGDSAPEQTTVRIMHKEEEVARLMSDGEEDVDKTQAEIDEKAPASSTSQYFQIRFDLSSYKPDDIRVVVRSGDVIVEAERESTCDGYSETETLRRRIRLPDKVDQSMLTSVLNAEGKMTIQAPFLSQAISWKEEKTVPVIWE
ncbi:dynein heavy chain-like protein 2 [Haliotis cracherodii]|uniref:dynein heavy chain-like protein 2 n=1 Tax=Haliotis cracherodii TaxID=6455 RepID=UPI0039E8154A